MDEKDEIIATLTADLNQCQSRCCHYLKRIGEQGKEKEALQQALATVTAERDLYRSQVQKGLAEGLFLRHQGGESG